MLDTFKVASGLDVSLELAGDRWLLAGDNLNNVITGNTLGDALFGNAGLDTLNGGDGDDLLSGGGGNDTIVAGNGNDFIIGGQGVDVMTGGLGVDTYEFLSVGESAAGAGSRDTITDFNAAEDVIDLFDIVAGDFAFIGTDQSFLGGGTASAYVDTLTELGKSILKFNTTGDGTTVDMEIDITGFTGALSAANFAVDGVANAQPILDDTQAANMTAIDEDATVNPGTTVAGIIAPSAIADPDGVVEAIAIVAVDEANGVWEYSLDGGSTFNPASPVSSASALLLDETALMRFVPDADFNGSATFTFRAWDKSQGVAGDKVTIAGNGSISAGSDTAIQTVSPVNDAPVLVAPILLFGSAFDDNLIGGIDDETIIGGGGADTLSGGAGNDVLIGGLGADTLTGGAGVDAFLFTDRADSVAFPPAASFISDFNVAEDFITFGGFIDPALDFVIENGTALQADDGFASATFGSELLAVDVDDDGLPDMAIILNGVADGTLTSANFLNFGGFGGPEGSPNDIYGTLFDDNITNVIGEQNVFGGFGNDQITGGGEFDSLIGGLGADLLFGGVGEDFFVYRQIADSASADSPAVDTIIGFEAGGDGSSFDSIDIIELRFLEGAAFNYVGAGPLSGGGTASAGLTFIDAGTSLLSIDVSGNGLADMEIVVDSLTGTLDASDFDTGFASPPFSSGGPVDFTEDGGPIFASPAIIATDVDGVDFGGGTLTVQITGGFQPGDVLGFDGSADFLDLSAGVTTGSDILDFQTVLGTISADGSGGTLSIDLTANAFQFNVNDIARSITFENTSNNPGSAARTLSFTLTDGDGGTSNVLDQTVNVIPVNDAPTIAAVTTTGDGMAFDGVNDTVAIPSSATLATGAGDFTYEAWINTGLTGVRQEIFSIGPATTSNGAFMQINASGQLQLDLADIPGPSGGPALNDGLWHHTAVTYDSLSGVTTLFVDGEEVASATALSPNILAGAGNIGSAFGTSFFFGGQIDDVRVYDAALSGDAIRADMGGFVPADPVAAGLQLHYDFDDVTGQTVSNLGAAGVAADGTLGADALAGADEPTPVGFNGQAMVFAGAESVDVAANAEMSSGTGPFTYETWFKTGSATNQSILDIGSTTAGQGYNLTLNTLGHMGLTLAGGTAISIANNYADGLWHHVAVVNDGLGNLSLIVDGGEATTSGALGGDIVSGGLSIGRDLGGINPGFVGEMFDVRAYDVARASTDIQSDMIAPAGPGDLGLVAAWPLNGSNGSTVADIIGDNEGTFESAGVPATPTFVDTNPFLVAEDSVLTGTIDATDVDGDVLSFAIGAQGANGTAAIDFAGDWSYTPNADFFGADSFTVSVADGNGGIVTRAVDVTVAPVNDDPVILGASGGNTAVQFDGVDDFVRVADPAALLPALAGDPFTVEAWIQVPAGATALPLAAIGQNSGNLGIEIQVDGDGTLTALSPGGAQAASSTPVNDGGWHHVAVVYDGT